MTRPSRRTAHPARPARLVLPALALPAAVVLAGCTADLAAAAEDPTGVPARWLDETADGWPESDAFGALLPVDEHGAPCLLTDDTALLGEETEVTSAGWGLWHDEDDQGSYRYTCHLWAPDVLSAEVRLVQTAAESELTAAVAEFVGQPSTVEQDNAVETVTSRGLEVHVLTRWYPTNPQGEYQALYADPASGAFVVLEVNSLDRADFDATTPQQVADDLTDLLARG